VVVVEGGAVSGVLVVLFWPVAAGAVLVVPVVLAPEALRPLDVELPPLSDMELQAPSASAVRAKADAPATIFIEDMAFPRSDGRSPSRDQPLRSEHVPVAFK
jgi:hypothetical protein